MRLVRDISNIVERAYSPPSIVATTLRQMLHDLHYERPQDAKDALFVMNPWARDQIAMWAYEHQQPDPPPPEKIDILSIAEETRNDLTGQVLGIQYYLTPKIPKHTIELWIENETDRAIRRAIEVYGEARVMISRPSDYPTKEPAPDPTLGQLIMHWRMKAGNRLRDIVAKTRRQV